MTPIGAMINVYAIRGPNCGMELSQLDNIEALSVPSFPITNQLLRAQVRFLA